MCMHECWYFSPVSVGAQIVSLERDPRAELSEDTFEDNAWAAGIEDTPRNERGTTYKACALARWRWPPSDHNPRSAGPFRLAPPLSTRTVD